MRAVSITFTNAEAEELKIVATVKRGQLPLLVTALGTLQSLTSAELAIEVQICFNPAEE